VLIYKFGRFYSSLSYVNSFKLVKHSNFNKKNDFIFELTHSRHIKT